MRVYYTIFSGFMLAVSYIAHLKVFNRFLRLSMSTKSIEYFLTNIIIVGLIAAGLSFLPQFYDFWANIDLNSGRVGIGINILNHYLLTFFFLLTLCVYGRLILEQKLLQVYKQIALFKSYLLIAAFMQPLLPFLPNFVAITLFIAGILSVTRLLLHLRWVAALNMRDKWLILFCLSILILLSLFFIQKIPQIRLDAFVQNNFWGNTFGIIVILTVLIYGILSWLALMFSMPLASFIEEQRSEIAAFQEMSRNMTAKNKHTDVWQRLFEACYKNTGSEAGWLATYLSGKGIDENPLIAQNITREQIAVLHIKSNIKEHIALAENNGANSYYYEADLYKKGLEAVADLHYRSLLILTIFQAQSKQVIAIICLVKSFSDGYSRYMIELCQSYIAQVNLTLENLQLVSETVRTARVRQELEIAGKVQKALMPKKFPENPYCEIAGYNEPAVEVGGDYYDYCRIDEQRTAFIIGDVSGKGASAAFHMAQMKGIFQSLLQFTSDAEQFMAHANHAVARCMEKSRFVSIILLLLDFEKYTFTYSRAGHCPLLYYNAASQTVEMLMGQGMALGIIRNNDFERFIEAINRPVNAGDVFLLYTDGLVEARRGDTDEQFGYERLKQTLETHSALSADEIAQRIYADFSAFSVGSDFKDDTSLLVIKVKKP